MGAELFAVAKDFAKKWKVPNCVGAVDGKHVPVQALIGSGRDYFNYKQFFGIVLLAIVDANFSFVYINIGSQGRVSDGGFNHTSFKIFLDYFKLNLPADCVLQGINTPFPYIYLADNAFWLTCIIMKPYAGAQAKRSKTNICNYRVSKKLRIAENVFGIMSNVFRVFRRLLVTQSETMELATLAAVYLHNFMRRISSRCTHTPPGTFDTECSDTTGIRPGDWRTDQEMCVQNFSRIACKKFPNGSRG
jgi:hypothetical protein